MADWDETNPEDSDLVSQYPANARAARAAVRTNFGVDHHEANDGDVGKHEVIQLTPEATPTIESGDIGIWNDSGTLKTRVGAGTVEEFAVTTSLSAPAGTKLIFYQASAPTGWTQDVAVNDRVLRVVSGTGGGTGGSWTISGVTVNNHVLTVAQLPSHNHGGSTGSSAPSTNSTGSHSHSGTASSAGAHGHDVLGSTSTNDEAVAGVHASNADGGFAGYVSTFSVAFRASGGGGTLIESGGAHTHPLSIDSAGSHSHTVSSHSHSVSSQGSDSGHNHGVTADGNWRPSHIDVIVATKD